MFVREKTARGQSYLYLVENQRDGGRIRQRMIRALGRKDVLLASGELDRLTASLARHCDRAVMLSHMEAGRRAASSARALAGRCCSGGCGSGSALPRSWASCCRTAVLSLPSSALSLPAFCTGCLCRARTAAARNGWITGIEGLQLHHLYRAMAWLGEEIAPAAAGALAPRCVKDLIEERLFERRRDLFSDLSLVFMDTTSLSFYGAGGDSLGAYGHSKDHRADLRI